MSDDILPFDMYDWIRENRSNPNTIQEIAQIFKLHGRESELRMLNKFGKWYLDSMSFMDLYAATGHLRLLQYAHWKNYEVTHSQFIYAAANGQLDVLKYLVECADDNTDQICTHAAKHGHLDCLQYLHENGFPWNEHTCAYAAINGHLDCLKYAHSNGCPLSYASLREDVTDPACLDYLLRHITLDELAGLSTQPDPPKNDSNAETCCACPFMGPFMGWCHNQ
jgi:ankyrin repeat protein